MTDVLTSIGVMFNELWTMLFTKESPFGFTYGVLFSGLVALGILVDVWTKIFYNEIYVAEKKRLKKDD
jgi:hypothetical protein